MIDIFFPSLVALAVSAAEFREPDMRPVLAWMASPCPHCRERASVRMERFCRRHPADAIWMVEAGLCSPDPEVRWRVARAARLAWRCVTCNGVGGWTRSSGWPDYLQAWERCTFRDGLGFRLPTPPEVCPDCNGLREVKGKWYGQMDPCPRCTGGGEHDSPPEEDG